jgi:hypothetical protein
VHPDTSNPDDSKTLGADTLITLTATKTDKDGDAATATLNIGQNFNFEDDGPSISTTGTEPTATVDETVLATNATADFSVNFSSSFGADGAGTLAYSLGISAVGADSGLVDTASGHGVFLYLESGQVVGRVGSGAATADPAGAISFTVSLNSTTGVVTLDQVLAIVHPDTSNPDDSKTLGADTLITLTATKTDKDGDAATATLNIGQNFNFEDDGPTASAVLAGGAVAHDETAGVQADANDTTAAAVIALFSGVATPSSQMTAGYAQGSATVINSSASTGGADGLASTAYSLAVSATGVDSGLDTVDGQNILLYKEGALVVGRIGSSSGAAAFAVSIDATSGVLSMVQYNAIKHPTGGASSPDESLSIASTALLAVATVTDGDGDTNAAQVAIGASVSFQDDGPAVAFGNLIGTGTVLPQTGYWTMAAGTDTLGATGLDISLTGFTLVRPNGSTDTTGTSLFNELAGSPDGSGNYLFGGTLTGDFDNNAATAPTSVDFNLTAYADGHYTLDLVQGFQSTIVTSTAGGSLGAGGPDPVQTLTLVGGAEQVVFFAVNPIADQTGATSIASAIQAGAPDYNEAYLQAHSSMVDSDGISANGNQPGDGTYSFINDTYAMNVSTSGIGVNNNVLQGNNTVGFQADDESFVINPQSLLTGMKVFIDNSVGGYNMATEDLYYRTYYSDGTVSATTEVNTVTPEAGGQVSFTIQREGTKQIDAVQLLMGRGDIKIPVIQFITETENLASDVKLDFSATVTDKDGDTATDAFSANLYANELSASFDFMLAGAGSVEDAFNIDLSSAKNTYQVTGFDTGALRDKLVLLGTAPTSVAIDNSGADSLVSILESGGQTTTVTVVGVDLLATDIV